MTQIIAYHNRYEYFFTTDHIQSEREDGNVPGEFIPTTYTIPQRVVPRKGCDDGIVDSKEKWKVVYGLGEEEIPNPNPKYQA